MPDIEIVGAKLLYATFGKGEPILLIPGSPMEHTYYRLDVPISCNISGASDRSPQHRPLKQIAAVLHRGRLGQRTSRS